MHNELTAIVECDKEWFIAYCPEIPEANGQGKTKAEAIQGLAEAIELIFTDRRQEALDSLPEGAQLCTVEIDSH